jgi:hypothetical protein
MKTSFKSPFACLLKHSPIRRATPFAFGIVIGFLGAASQSNAAEKLPVPVPVEVHGNVEVTGAVETLDDALQAPFVRAVTVFITSGSNFSVDPGRIDISAGKRLVVETIAIRVRVENRPGGAPVQVTLDHAVNEGGQIFFTPVVLPVPFMGNFLGDDQFSAVIPFRARIDGTAESDRELSFTFLTSDVVPFGATLTATVYGRLVDI